MAGLTPSVAAELPAQRRPIGSWRPHRPRLIAPLRWVLLSVVLLSVATWLVVTPRASSGSAFAQDLQSGKVRTYDVGDANDLKLFRGFTLGDDSSPPSVTWCTSRVSCYIAPVDDLRWLVQETATGDEAVPTDGPAEFDDGELVPTFINRFSATPGLHAGRANGWVSPVILTCTLAWVIALWVLATGPQPRRATKWAAFWILVSPGALGLLWILVREAPWSRRAAATPEPPPGPLPGRWTGGWTFIVLLLTSGILRELPSMLRDLLP